jgi:uncharacterized protein involved in tolerance to divalent cations
MMKTADAIAAFGGVNKLAAALQIWPQSIYQWGEYVPELRRYQIEQMLKERDNKA